MSILESELTFTLPYTNAGMCYERLETFQPIFEAFRDTIVPTATSGVDFGKRLSDIESQRQQALDDYLEAGNSLREVDTTLNCCIADLYTAMFDTLGKTIQSSDLTQSEKLARVDDIHALLPNILSWNPTKRNQLDLMVRAMKAKI